MTLASARRRYVTDAVQTVNPHQLVVMLYDRLLLDISRAGEALETNNFEVVNQQLTHAQDIILELQTSLNPDVWSGGPALMQLYTFIMGELVGANVAKDAGRIEACRKLIAPLADAWRTAAAQLADGLVQPAPSLTPAPPTGATPGVVSAAPASRAATVQEQMAGASGGAGRTLSSGPPAGFFG